jgi:cyclopropane fatty-acyl-phospholipid synthase-like methyltransferase
MPRLTRRALILLLVAVVALAGCRKPRTGGSQASLTLAMPESAGQAPELQLEGQPVAVPADSGPLLVTPPKGGQVRLTCTFWPDDHTKLVRTKVVKVEPGESAEVNFLKEDQATPDRVFTKHQPTPEGVVAEMCQLAGAGKDDTIYDVGCGTGEVIVAAMRKTRAQWGVGLDYDEERADRAKVTVEKAGLAGKVKIVQEDVLARKDFSRPSVIFLSWTSPVNQRLASLLRETLRHGTRIVSCRSDLGDWRPDATRTVKGKGGDGREVEYTLRLWKVTSPEAPNLDLELPVSEEPPDYAPERVSKLLIDGKDFTKPRVSYRSVKVEPKPGADSVKVEYTFWPNTYTAITRTRTVKLQKGKLTRASLKKKDPAAPDHIRPIYVPTPDEVVERMCQLAKITKDDVVYDIGCGDGRLVIHAVKKYGAKKGIGIDIDPERIKDCKANASKAGVTDRVTFEVRDALKMTDFSEASVVLLYLGDHLNEALRPTLQKTLKPGARIVSHRFLMGDWKPEHSETIKARDNDGSVTDFNLHRWLIK